MPLPFIPLAVAAGAAVATAVAGKKGHESYKNMKETKNIAESMENQYKTVFNIFDQARQDTNTQFEKYGELKLNILSGTMKEFLSEFKKLKNVDFTNKTTIDSLEDVSDSKHFMQEIEKQIIAASDLLKSGVSAIAGGGLAAFGALGAATTFGAASTGTTIASLSGVAATNATLAFLGGGSLAAGGLGMAGGAAVLGGIALAPALALGSVIFAASTKKKLEEMKIKREEINVEIEKLKSAISILKEIQTYTVKLSDLTTETDNLFGDYIATMISIIDEKGIDYRNFSDDEQLAIRYTAELAIILKKLLDTPVIDENGERSKILEDVLKNTEKSIQHMY
ncbi:TPA: hypothetical protein ACOQ31_003910 [Bacillus cereus]|uniref:hypothetical protein n=1 Tax=Bacillus cereus TaxID=1396 RepID=UPI0019268B86|nr:hypothetical protein [Bacillus cereus]MBL3764094.1 hypothetical protein [Bacillus cereus]MBL3772655.1 hypothetical protein [Bacillus cereus]MBL3775779.1 hypothetical protein [Bacillus cereus]MBL3786848.1 hypothetical protein [Bacillus cereus]